MSVSVTSSSLMKGLFTGKADAWATVVHLYQPLVLKWCNQSDLQYADALNVSQEVFHGVSKGIHKYQYGVFRFRNWLRGITKNKIKDHYRTILKTDEAKGGSNFEHKFKNLPDKILEESDVDEEQESLILLIQALELIKEKINPQSWNITWETVVEGDSVKSVAMKYGITVGAAYKARSRVLSRLRTELRDLIE